MGVYIKIPNVTFTKYLGVAEIEDEPIVPDVPDVPDEPVVPDEPTVPDTYPVTDTLKGLYYLGGTIEESVVNHKEGGANATAAGGVAVNDGAPYATFTGTETAGRIITDIITDPNNTTTIVALFRVPTGKRPIVSNCAMGKPHITITNKDVRYRLNNTADATTFAGGDIVSTTNFALVALTASTNGFRAVRSTADGNFVTLASDTVGVDAWGADKFNIGGAHTSFSYTDTADIALAAIHEGDMSDEQLKQIFSYVRNKYAVDKGLTVE